MSFTASSSEDLESGHGTTWFSAQEQELENFCRTAPKVELHIHLDGCFDPHELWTYLEHNPELLHCFPVEKQLPWEQPSDSSPAKIRENVSKCTNALEYRRLCTCRRRYRKLRHDGENDTTRNKKHKSLQHQKKKSVVKGSLEDMLLCFEFFTPLVYNNFVLLEHLAYDFCQRQYEQNVIYTEVRYSPQLLASDPRQAHAAITKGLRRGCQELNNNHDNDNNNNGNAATMFVVNQILCAIDFAPDWAADVVGMAIEFRNDFPCAVVGIDIAAGEAHFSKESSTYYQAHYDMCQKAIQHDIPVTLHAGEVPESRDNVRKAIQHYGARRIGHGYAIAGDHETMDWIKARQDKYKIHFEACPTSSIETGGWIKTDWKDHPACILRKNDLSVSLSSDDPAVFNTSLTWQWRIALKKMGFTNMDLLEMTMDAMEASFAPLEQKERILKALQQQSAILLSKGEPNTSSSNHSNNDNVNINNVSKTELVSLDFRDRVYYD